MPQKSHLFFSYHKAFKHLYLLLKSLAETRRIDCVVSVNKFIPNPCAREISYYRATHGKLIEVIVSEMSYYPSHLSIVFIEPFYG